MPAQIFGTPAVVTILNRAFNDASPSNATFNNQVAAAGTTREANLAFAQTFGAGFAGLTADAASTKLLGNLGLLPNADLQTGLKDYIASVGIANIGIVALQLGEILSGLENATGAQSIYAAPALAWNNEVTAGYNYSASPSSTTPSTGTSNPGQTFTLTTGNDFADVAGSFRNASTTDAGFKFTSSNDAVNATTTTIGGAGANNDSLTDSSTTDNDVLNLTMTGATNLGSVTNIETIAITTAATVAAHQITNVSLSGVKTITVAGAAAGQVDLAVSTSAGLARANSIDSTGLTSTGSIKFDASGRTGAPSEQAITVKLGGQGASLVTTSGGADDVTGGLGSDTINTGAGNDTINGGGGNDIINAGSGNDIINGGSGNNSITGGSGDDTITITSGNVDTLIFGTTGVLNNNGKDTITGFTAGTSATADILNFGAFVSVADTAATAIITLNATSAADVGVAATAANSILVLDRGIAIAAENYSSATDFAKVFANTAAVSLTATAGATKILVVQGTDQTQIYAIDTARDGTGANVTADDVVLVGVLTDVTNINAFVAANFTV